ncbi:YcnI family protein [Cellulomonas sp. IC4_254]|uniref:YcnI family copper-binding membrane protein n=1 Tax=Cellulomonas sp. IC4_254 TaxID=2714040 RepID=UPI0014214F96|nr:YcnI family protein [Cellulomonas sp. IC4_254]NHT16587.1 YcnI family protein [Cellulomonas sp. IC4_254]
MSASPRALVRAAAGSALAAALVLGSAAATSAHVRVVPETTAAGGWTVLTFRVPNESPTSATTRVTVDLPTGTPLTSVSTQPVPGWTATVERGALPEPVEVDGATITEAPLSVTWTADGAGIGDGEFQQFAISVGPLPAAGTDLVLPAHQEYADGEVVDWDQVAEGDAEPDNPAPAFTTTEAAADGHGAADASEDAAEDGPAEAAPSSDEGSGALPVVLGGLGLAAGVGALVVALLAWRRAAAR